MYLSKSINWNGEQADMVGFIPGSITMHDTPARARIGAIWKETGQGAWSKQSDDDSPAIINAHEFHYASIDGLPKDTVFRT